MSELTTGISYFLFHFWFLQRVLKYFLTQCLPMLVLVVHKTVDTLKYVFYNHNSAFSSLLWLVFQIIFPLSIIELET